MKRTAMGLAFVALFGMATAHASQPFESHFWMDFDWPVEVESNPVFLPNGVLKEELISVRYAINGDWVGVWEHSGFLTANPNGTLFAFGKGSFTGQILGSDGKWYTGSLEFVVHTKAKITADWSILSMWTQWTILRGAGELQNLLGHGVEDAEGKDTAWLHFEPKK